MLGALEIFIELKRKDQVKGLPDLLYFRESAC
jgi:hypothetical protein